MKQPRNNRNPRARAFVETSVQYGSQWRRVASAKCRDCLAVDTVGIKTGTSQLPPEAIEKKFIQKGWLIGSNENWDICPSCAEKVKALKPVLKIVNHKETAPKEAEVKPELKPVVPVVIEPRTMQRDDRRIIFEKLNGVYLDEKRGYDPDWSDHKVSIDLGVPRAWVEQVREEMFGPINTNADIEAFRKAVEDLASFKGQLKSVQEARDQVEAIRNMIGGINLASLLDRIAKVEKLEALIRKHIPG